MYYIYICMHMYVCMYACMYVCMYVAIYMAKNFQEIATSCESG